MEHRAELIVDTTQNRLVDFDLAVSITEGSINAQLEDAWYKWHSQTDDLAIIRQTDPEGAVLELALDRPVLTLAPPDAGPNQVLVSFRLDKGRLLAANGFDFDLTKQAFSFRTTLRQHAVSQDELYAMSRQAGNAANRLIQGKAGAFTIECLYMNLDDMEAVSNLRLMQPVAELLRAYFRAQDRRFLVNAAIWPREPERQSSFIVSDLRFKIAGDALDYHGVVADGLAMPPDGAEARFGPWITPDRVDGRQALVAGVMALRGAKVGEKVRAGLEAAMRIEYDRMHAENNGVHVNGRHPEAQLLNNASVSLEGPDNRIVVRSDDGKNTYQWTSQESVGPVRFRLVKTLEFILTPVAHRAYRVSGTCTIRFSRARDGLHREVENKLVNTVRIEGEMTLAAASDGRRCDITPKLRVSFGPGGVDLQPDFGGSLDELGKSATDITEVLNFTKFVERQIGDMLTESCEKINVSIADFALIPPAEEAFNFARPRFSPGGDLLLDIVYRAVLDRSPVA